MYSKDIIQKMLYEMTLDDIDNVMVIENYFEQLGMDMDNALLALTSNLYSEDYCLLAIKSLLKVKGCDPNLINSSLNNFIDNAIESGYSGYFIYKLVEMATDDKQSSILLDVNDVDYKGRTLLHRILYSESCKGDIVKIFEVFIDKGFDCSIKDENGRNVFFALADSEANGLKHDGAAEFKFFFDKWVSSNYKELEDIPLCKDEIGFDEGVNQLLKELTGDVKKDYLYLFHGGDYLKHTVSQLCRVLVGLNLEPKKVLYAIKAALSNGYNVAVFNDNDGDNIVQMAIRAGYDNEFIKELIKVIFECEKKDKKFNINHVNKKGETMLHSAIYSDMYREDISKLYEFFLDKGFDSNIVDNSGRNIIGAMSYMMEHYKKYTDRDISDVVDIMSYSSMYVKSENAKIEKMILDSNEVLIEKILDQMSGDLDKNKEIIDEVITKRKDWNHSDLLYVLTTELRDEKKCYYAIKTLLFRNHVNPNYTPLNGQNSFIQNAINYGYSERFVSMIIKDSIFPSTARNLKINYKNHKGENILHSAIRSENYKGSVLSLYKKIIPHKFDSRILDGEGLSLIGVIEDEQKRSGKFGEEELEELRKLYYEQVRVLTNYDRFMEIARKKTMKTDEEEPKNDSEPVIIDSKKGEKKKLSSGQISELEEYGTILNYKNFISEPVIGREREMENLMVCLAQDKKSPIIVGESGVGKSALVYELAYLIENDKVPNFLKGKIVYEVSPGELVAGCTYVGQFEAKINALFDVARKYNVILFIDEIHTMYGVGTSDKKVTGMQDYIKHFLDRNESVKLIGTTTEEEYQKFMAGDALKRRFEKISVEEPDEKMLRKIIGKVIDDYCLKAKMSFVEEKDKEDVVEIILEATDRSHRVYNDRVNNPDLAISIIDKAFAFAKYFDSENIEKEHFMKAFEYCDRIYESAREEAAIKLKEKNNVEKKEKTARILEYDFTKFKR